MVSKVRERVYAETAARLLGVAWSFREIPEPVDFEVHAANEVFGLEVRNVFVDTEAPSVRPHVDASRKIRVVFATLPRGTTAKAAPRFRSNFLGIWRKSKFDRLSNVCCVKHLYCPLNSVRSCSEG